jgi:hypothetical protein
MNNKPNTPPPNVSAAKAVTEDDKRFLKHNVRAPADPLPEQNPRVSQVYHHPTGMPRC